MLQHLESMYAFYAFAIAVITAQAIKPVFYYMSHRKWKWSMMYASGGYPSSHTAAVTALSLAIGFRDGFSSPLFAVVLAFSIIVGYDAANVRYYAGRNIQLTQQLVRDIQELTKYQLNDPIYFAKVKEVLGHKWIEVIGGIIHGAIVAYILYIL